LSLDIGVTGIGRNLQSHDCDASDLLVCVEITHREGVSINLGQAKIYSGDACDRRRIPFDIGIRLIVPRLERNMIELGSLAADPHELCMWCATTATANTIATGSNIPAKSVTSRRALPRCAGSFQSSRPPPLVIVSFPRFPNYENMEVRFERRYRPSLPRKFVMWL
jgi:hypothetical protein